MKPASPALQLRELESRIDALAKARGTSQARLRRMLEFTLTCGVLSRGIAEGIIPLYLVKGGVALELRLGLRARATKDIDIGLCAPPSDSVIFPFAENRSHSSSHPAPPALP